MNHPGKRESQFLLVRGGKPGVFHGQRGTHKEHNRYRSLGLEIGKVSLEDDLQGQIETAVFEICTKELKTERGDDLHTRRDFN